MNKENIDSLPRVPVSWGELIDKVTILEIKSRRLSSSMALANVGRELAMLNDVLVAAEGVISMLGSLKAKLTAVNERLWDIEDNIRMMEAHGQFDEDFIQLARSVYTENDERAAIKRQINMLLSSHLVEEKSYAPYQGRNGST